MWVNFVPKHFLLNIILLSIYNLNCCLPQQVHGVHLFQSYNTLIFFIENRNHLINGESLAPVCLYQIHWEERKILTSLCFHTCYRTPCGYRLESSQLSMSLYQLLAAPGPGQELGSVGSGTGGPRWMTRRCWWGWGRWKCSPPGR